MVFAVRSHEREMFVLDHAATRWRTQPLSRTLGKVLAATYEETSGWLVVLEAHAPERMRFRRIDPFSGQTHAVRGSELDLNLAKTWALAAAPDGSVYLVVGNKERSLILRGLVTPSLIWRGEQVIDRRYPRGPAPVASDLGLSFIVEAPGGSALTGVRTSELVPPDPNHWKDIL